MYVYFFREKISTLYVIIWVLRLLIWVIFTAEISIFPMKTVIFIIKVLENYCAIFINLPKSSFTRTITIKLTKCILSRENPVRLFGPCTLIGFGEKKRPCTLIQDCTYIRNSRVCVFLSSESDIPISFFLPNLAPNLGTQPFISV